MLPKAFAGTRDSGFGSPCSNHSFRDKGLGLRTVRVCVAWRCLVAGLMPQVPKDPHHRLLLHGCFCVITLDLKLFPQTSDSQQWQHPAVSQTT